MKKRKQRIAKPATAQRGFHHEPLEPRCLLAGLQGITVDDGSLLQSIENTAPGVMTLIFDADEIISDAPSSMAGISLVHGGDDRMLDTSDDIIVQPGFVGIGDRPNEVVMRFAENLPDNIYRLAISGNGSEAVRNVFGEAFDQDPNQAGIQDYSQTFRLDLGAQIVAVVPQPVERNADGSLTQNRDQIVVYFNNDPLDQASAERPDFYQLRFTGHSDQFTPDVDTAHDMDDVVHLPTSVAYDATTNRATLTFATPLDQLDNGGVDGAGTYRLQIGLNNATPLKNRPTHVDATTDPGDTFTTATDLGEVFARGVLIDAAIDTRVDPIRYPGAVDEIGHRDIPAENHFVFGEFASDLNPGATTILYNFQDVYGVDPDGNPLHNLITENQKRLARQILDIYSYYGGVQFVETGNLGFSIATGDLRAANPAAQTGPGGAVGISTAGNFIDGIAIMDATEKWTDEYSAETGSGAGISWFSTAMREIGHILGLGDTYDLPPNTIMGQDETGGPILQGTQTVGDPEPTFPGTHDITHLQHVHRPESNDLDLYRFEVGDSGVLTIETFAERLENSSLADTQIAVWQEVNGKRVKIASNNDYFSEDSYLELSVDAGTYFVGVSSTGNDGYNPAVADSGAGGTSQGKYQLRIHHRNELAANQQIQDRIDSLSDDPKFTPTEPQPLDGDYDGSAGGAYNFWFRVATPENTILVDKAGFGDFTQIDQAMNAAQIGDIVRVVGNGGADGDVGTLDDNLPYLLGKNLLNATLEDGASINVKRGVTLMVDEGAILKLRGTSIIAGSTAPSINRSGSAVQILGTPDHDVYLGSLRDDTLGGDSDGFPQTAQPGDWGGILFTGIIDQNNGVFNYEDQSIFLNYINHANISNAGGQIAIDSVAQTVAPIEMRDLRATTTFNTITGSAESAIAATPDSFKESNYHTPQYQQTEFTADYTRIGPVIHGNYLLNNTLNGLFLKTETVPGQELLPMTVSGRWDDTDIPHLISENFEIQGDASVLLDENNTLPTPQEGVFIARPDARLRIDPGTVVKLDGAVIEVGNGAQLLAEGVDGKEVIFTSLFDNRFGGSGTFNTTSDASSSTTASPGDWGGIYLGFTSSASIDRARISYGGGIVPVEGSFTGFNVLEVHQADLRMTNSILDNNAGGTGGQAPATRFGRTTHEPAAIFVRNAQPILINNIIQNTLAINGEELASAININVNSLNRNHIVDYGRSTGRSDAFTDHVDNQGPLIVGNRLGGNDLNGMEVRGGTLTVESVWDDTDMVHLVFSEIASPNFHTFGGLRLESSPLQSLVVKLSSEIRPQDPIIDAITFQRICPSGEYLDIDGDGFTDACGAGAGFSASGRSLDIDDRIGGSVKIVGHPNFPVVLTSVYDNSVGAGQTPDGEAQLTAFAGDTTRLADAGDWRSVRFEKFSNDRNVDSVIEYEPIGTDYSNEENPRNNANTANAQFIGQLAPNEKSGDENLRLGFTIHGTLARPNDVDTYSFEGTGGTEVWFDLDHSTNSLDSVIDFIDADGNVIASSSSSHLQLTPDNNTDPSLPDVNALSLSKSGYYLNDYGTINPRDPGMRLTLPGAGTNTYHVQVRSNGSSAGSYQLQIRMREVDEIAGSTVRFADIRFATNGIELLGVPGHSPLLGEADEIDVANDTIGQAQFVGNVLNSDLGALSIAGTLEATDDVDWFEFEVTTELIGSGSSYASVTIDLDYSDGTSRANASFALYNGDNHLIGFADDSSIADDLNAPDRGSDVDDLTRGSFGVGDGFLGPIRLPEGNYRLAVFSDAMIPRELAATLQRDLMEEFPDEVNRFIPNDAVSKIPVDDAVAVDRGDGQGPLLIAPVPLTLNDIKLFVTTDGPNSTTDLNTVNVFTGAAEYIIGRFDRPIGDLAVRYEDGALVSLTHGTPNEQNDEMSGNAIVISPEDGSLTGLDGSDEFSDDLIKTYQDDGTMMGTAEELDVGVNFEALTFGGNSFWGVGNLGVPGGTGIAYEENILYQFNAFDLTAQPQNENLKRSADGAIAFDGSYTDVVDRGYIDTENSAAGDERLTVLGNATGNALNFFVNDGHSFTADGTTYEMNTGAQIVVTAEDVRDGDVLQLTIGNADYDLQFDTGPVLELRTITGVAAGGTFTFGTSTFEYVMGNPPQPGNFGIEISGIATIDQLAQRIEAIVEGATGGAILVDAVNAVDNGTPTVRISFQNDTGAPGTSVPSTGFLGGNFEGEYGGQAPNGISFCSATSTCILVGVEEDFNLVQISDAIIDAYEATAGLQTDRIGSSLGRMNFLDASQADFRERVNNGGLDFIDVRPGDNSVAAGNVGIEFLAQDTDEDVAARIADEVPGASVDPRSANTVVINTGWSNVDNPPFQISGSAATGGLITGIAYIDDGIYAVSDMGGLFRVDDPGTPGAPVDVGVQTTTRFVADIGAPLTALTRGPLDYDEGSLADILIAMDAEGFLHAFDTNGNPVDIFSDGGGGLTNSVATGLTGTNGIGFSNYQINAWHVRTPDGARGRDNDPGHGVVTPVTGITEPGLPGILDNQESIGGASFYFGRQTRQEFSFNGFNEVPAYEYNYSGGARGSLVSEPFSLVDIDAADEPFVYFNYLVDTEDTDAVADEMADSIRVYLEDEAGAFHLLATNNSLRNEEFSFDDSVNSANYGRIQELFDDRNLDDDGNKIRATTWRQARIPLWQFATQSDLRLRFDFATEGGRNDATLPADGYGRYQSTLNTRSTGATDNDHEGIWIDDIIIGLAERGELITNTNRDSDEARIVPNLAVPDQQISVGDYQVEIRRSMPYDVQGVIESNDRLAESVLIQSKSGPDLAPAGQVMILSNGNHEYVFEFVEEGQTPTVDASYTIGFQPGATALQVATSMVATINAVNRSQGMDITAELTRGVTAHINLHGEVVTLINAQGLASFELFEEFGDQNRERPQGQVVINSNYIRDSAEYGIRVEAAARDTNDGSLAHPGSPILFVETNQSGLAPGAALVNNLLIRGGVGGILVSGDAQAEDSTAAGRAATPFARILNNTFVGARSGSFGNGITIENNASPTLLNNVFDRLLTGIVIDASSSSTIVGGSLFRNVTQVGTAGDFALQLASFETLFVNALADNFFPDDKAKSIDSSIDSLNDRDEMVTVREPLGISASPILAPIRDASGQLRVDDPNVDNSSGQGADVFVDRGALDRSDFIGPNASMIGPLDNDSDGLDLNPEDHDISLLEDATHPIQEFLIQLLDGGGTDNSLGGFGVDDATVVSSAITVYRDDDPLTEGVEYSFEFDSTNNQIHLVSATGIWPVGIYRIELSDSIADVFGNPLLANRAGGTTVFNVNIGGGAFDFGDAPSPYPTQLDANGARHSLLNGTDLFLGGVPTSESNARDSDEDDGITFNTEYVQGATASFTATASGNGFLDAWFDFNGNGNWTDPGEKVADSIAVISGTNVLVFTVPAGATVGDTYARFRISANGGLGPTGEVDGGEVEDYLVTIDSPGDDLGDAPSIYPTLRANNGAVHTIIPGIYLGNGVDGEEDAAVSTLADGDTQDDGVVFVDPFLVGKSTTVSVTASVNGYLNAWIDWNNDRTWSADEQVFDDTPLVAGANELTLETPTTAVSGQTIGRFRFTTTTGHQVTGTASDGEVEDYLIDITKQSWHNASNPEDVNDNGTIEPLDALLVINELNVPDASNGPGLLPDVANSPPFLDTNNDGYLSPIDALIVINRLNAASNAALSTSANSPVQNSPVQNSPVQNSPVQNSPSQNSPVQNSPSQSSPSVSLRDLAFEAVDGILEDEEEDDDTRLPWWLT